MNEESPKIVPTHHVGSFQAAVQDGMEIGAQAMPSSLLKLRTQVVRLGEVKAAEMQGRVPERRMLHRETPENSVRSPSTL